MIGSAIVYETEDNYPLTFSDEIAQRPVYGSGCSFRGVSSSNEEVATDLGWSPALFCKRLNRRRWCLVGSKTCRDSAMIYDSGRRDLRKVSEGSKVSAGQFRGEAEWAHILR